MSVRKIISLALSLVLSVSLVACSSNNGPQEPIKVLSPTGAPALSLLSLYENENVEILPCYQNIFYIIHIPHRLLQ